MSNVFFDKSLSNEEIVGIERNGYKWYFNSKYSAIDVAKAFAESVDVKSTFGVIIIFGYANGMYVKEMQKKYPNNAIICYEPNEEIYEKYSDEMKSYEKEEKKVAFCKKETDFLNIASQAITEINREYISYFISPNYDRVYEVETKRLECEIEKRKMEEMIMANTAYVWDSITGINNMYIIKDAVGQNVVADMIKKKDMMEGRPAIIVSAGPSLDKNVYLLKKMKNKALIIATDAALLVMDSHGIQPDVIVSIDATKNPKLFDVQVADNVPIVCSENLNYKVFEHTTGRRFYIASSIGYLMKMMGAEGERVIGTGGCVANCAFSLAIGMGAKQIVFIGQDLAFDGGRVHAGNIDNVVIDKKVINMEVDGIARFYVEGNLEEKVVTNAPFTSYRNWFERQIAEFENVEFINITAGGAKISGATYMNGEEYVEKYIDQIEEKDYLAELRSIETRYDEKKQEEVQNELKKIPEKIEEIKEYIRKIRNKYRELDKLNSDRKTNSTKLVSTVNKILEMQKEMQEINEFELLGNYNGKQEVIFQRSALETKENLYEEYKDVYNRGMDLMKMYTESIELFMKDYYEVFGTDTSK